MWQVDVLKDRLDGGCYGGKADVYLQRAKELGLKEVGIVDHLYRFRETRDYFEKNMILNKKETIGNLQAYWLERVMTEDMDDFVAAILRAKDKWSREGVELKLDIKLIILLVVKVS